MKLYRSFATVGGLTAISRVLGFVRDILIAAVLGAGWVADAFFVAFRFPNLFRALFAEGAFNSAFVPLFSKRLETEGRDSSHIFAEQAMAMLLTAVALTVIVAEIFMPALVGLLAPGFTADPRKFELAVLLSRITFPYIACMSAMALTAGLLNAFGKFGAPAAAPIILNLVLSAVMVTAAWLGFYNQPEAGVMLAWGVTVAGLAQLAYVALTARRFGMDLGFRRPRMNDDMRRLVSLGVPGLITGGINQINIFVGTMIASLQVSAVSYLYYADRLNQLPLGIVGIAIAVVLLPDLSRKLAAGDAQAAMDSQNRSLEFALILTLPAAVALIIAPHPIIQVLFERGAFSANDALQVSAALTAFAVGLPAFVMTKVFLPGFFAREDTRTPMLYAGVALAVNVIGSLSLFFIIGHVGIAVATSLAGWTNVILLTVTLIRRGHFRVDATLKRRAPLLVLCSALMGAVLWGVSYGLNGFFAPSNSVALQLGALAALIGSGAITYAMAAQLTGAMTLGALRRAVKKGT
ncbi:MAG: murein biosynthesis integral membrane protein MurJ [Hyphomicrobiales bacterium]|nr:murein biosynthesis integral membrane protein MurJ [Hyphomicrobiales bacterium]